MLRLVGHTGKDMRLGTGVLAGTLQAAAIAEVEDDAVRQFLAVLVRYIWRSEFGQRITLGDDLGSLSVH